MYISTPTQAPCEWFLLTLGDLQAAIFRVRHQIKNSLINTVLVERLFFLQRNQAAYFIIDEAVYIRKVFFFSPQALLESHWYIIINYRKGLSLVIKL